jgi:hypothetical protein
MTYMPSSNGPILLNINDSDRFVHIVIYTVHDERNAKLNMARFIIMQIGNKGTRFNTDDNSSGDLRGVRGWKMRINTLIANKYFLLSHAYCDRIFTMDTMSFVIVFSDVFIAEAAGDPIGR